jgi:hypothetical protein
MLDSSQLASAMLAIVFAAVMIIAGQLFIKSRAQTVSSLPAAQAFPTGLSAGSKPSRPAQLSF